MYHIIFLSWMMLESVLRDCTTNMSQAQIDKKKLAQLLIDRKKKKKKKRPSFYLDSSSCEVLVIKNILKM